MIEKMLDCIVKDVAQRRGLHHYTKGKTILAAVEQRCINCVSQPIFIMFSNTTSQIACNDEHVDNPDLVWPFPQLYFPHSAIHFAVGGMDIPASAGTSSSWRGKSGDNCREWHLTLFNTFFCHPIVLPT